MDINIIQILLIAIITFVAAIDQFSFLESLYQPIVIGPLVGLILGDLQTGLIIGGSYQLMMIGSMPVGGAQPPNAVIGGIMATVFAITLGLTDDPDAALGLSIPFALLGQYSVVFIFTITSGFMKFADKFAEDADTKKIEYLNYTTMGLLGLFFTIVVVIGLIAGESIGDALTTWLPDWAWGGLGTAGGMMRFVGFAVLMKVMLSREYWAFYFAGFALANIIAPNLGGQALALIAIIGFAIAYYDYTTNIKMRELGEGGNTDGI